jgi:anti-sigma regulatory factor (Ser/Thr protein kinase)
MSVSSQLNDRAINVSMPSRESQTATLQTDVAGPTALADAVSATRRFAVDHGLGTRDRAHLCIIVEELVANLIEHGRNGVERQIGVELVRLPAMITLAIEDDGAAFDPRNAPAGRNVPARGGGAGLRLVSAWSQIVDYRSAGGRNRLELEMPLTEG